MKRKVCTTTATPLGERKMSFTISTGAIDRDGDMIDPKGWDLAPYKRCPVVLWAHDQKKLPIAKATNVWTDCRGLHAQVEFPPEGLYPFADQVQAMVKAGFLNSTSVGFLPKESRPNRTGGHDITKAELLEFSIVAVPANPHALVTQRAANQSAVLKWLGTSDGASDWAAIHRSAEVDIDWASINRSRESTVEVSVTREDVRRVINHLMPAFKEGLRAGIRFQAQVAVEKEFLRLTGRID